MRESEVMADRFLELVQRLLREHPKLVFPDERVATIKQQMHDLKKSSRANPEDRIFLFRILAILRHSEVPPTMGELSARLEIPLSSVTRLVDGLVRAKFAERSDDPNDRRIVRLRMTSRGELFTEASTNFLRHRIQQLLEHFTADEQAQLLRLMSKLIDSLQVEQS
jgi:DNA-binding MarR family transcriptional regulator